MADSAAIPSCLHLRSQWMKPKEATFTPRNAYARIMQRQHSPGSCSVVQRFPSPNVQVTISRHANLKQTLSLKGSSLSCCCLGTLMNPESAPLNWVAVVDQVLLMTSIFLAHLAGVTPYERMPSGVPSSTRTYDSGGPSSTSYGRYRNIGAETKNDSWGEVKGKLADALESIEQAKLGSRTRDYVKRHPLNLFAVFEGPRLRLLWATLQLLQKEVNDISKAYELVDHDTWLAVSSEVVVRSAQAVCIKWLEEELSLDNIEPDKKLFSKISALMKGDNAIVQNISRLGKAELYAELLFFLRFSSLRTGCQYGNEFFTLYAVNILEDLLIMLADGATSIYLELISVDSRMSNEINGLCISLCNLSTRSLQRLRNEVALNQWLQQNFNSVVSMYEDRFELFVLHREQSCDPREDERKGRIWWKKFVSKKQTTSSYVHIKPFPLPVKRIKELRALTGWKYYFSLCLEFSDIAMPLARVVYSKVRSAVSFFLVCLIGRSLGLIYSGIRQSLGWS